LGVMYRCAQSTHGSSAKSPEMFPLDLSAFTSTLCMQSARSLGSGNILWKRYMGVYLFIRNIETGVWSVFLVDFYSSLIKLAFNSV